MMLVRRMVGLPAVPPEMLSWTVRLIYRQMAKRVAAVGEPWKTFFDPAALMAG